MTQRQPVFRLQIAHEAGLFIATSPDVRGLYVAERTIPDAIREAARAYEDLRRAEAYEDLRRAGIGAQRGKAGLA
ncbi:hypothetical protein [Methylobacterium sp. WSM2598]|uniref:hypothetical protein n=1 Tax=Methylobacterium sp. WSM2598 TaxID=398261 RepID=UPI00037D9557|nr:hypothetical protein [Methylobacterium sp. WSM2598]